MRKILLTSATLLILTGAAEARMYQWIDPASGTVQLSGVAPAWYRNVDNGPRVFVFDNGELIDDTAVQVPESQRLRLRADAVGHAATLVALADDSNEKADELRSAMEKAVELGVDVNAVANEFAAEQPGLSDDDAANELSDQASSLKALIEAYDQGQLEQARALIELLPQGNATPAPGQPGY